MKQQQLTSSSSSSTDNEPNEQQGKEKKELPPELHCEWLKFMPTPNAVQCLPKLGREINALKRIELKKKWTVWQTLCLRYNRAHYNASVVPTRLRELAIRTAQIRGEWTPMVEAITKSVRSRIAEEAKAKQQHPVGNDADGEEEALDGHGVDLDTDNAVAAVEEAEVVDDEHEQPAEEAPPADLDQEELLLQQTFRNQCRLKELKTGHGLVVQHHSNLKFQEEFLFSDLSELNQAKEQPKFRKRGLSDELLARLEAQYHSWGARKIRKKIQLLLKTWRDVFTNWNVKLAECKAAISDWQKHLDIRMINVLKESPPTNPNQPAGESGANGTLNCGTRKRKYCPVLTCDQVDQIAYDGYAIKRRRLEGEEGEEEEEEENEDVGEEEEDEEWQLDEEDEEDEEEEEQDEDEEEELWQFFVKTIRMMPPLPPLNQGTEEEEDEPEKEEEDYDQDEEVEYLGF